MLLNAQHCHMDLMKINQLVLSFSRPTGQRAHWNRDMHICGSVPRNSV